MHEAFKAIYRLNLHINKALDLSRLRRYRILRDACLCRGGDWLFDLFPWSSLLGENPRARGHSLGIGACGEATMDTGADKGGEVGGT